MDILYIGDDTHEFLVLSFLRATLSVTSLPQLNEVWRCP